MREDKLSREIVREFARLARLLKHEPALARAVEGERRAQEALRELRGNP